MPELIVAEVLRAVLEAGGHLPVVQTRPAKHKTKGSGGRRGRSRAAWMEAVPRPEAREPELLGARGSQPLHRCRHRGGVDLHQCGDP